MKFKKVVLSGVCAAALVVGTVAGTMAYLTAQTGVVTNTFTVGSLFDEDGALELWEHEAVDEDKNGAYELTQTEVSGNTYTVLPGVNIPKDPFVRVTDLQEDAYLFLKVTGEPTDDFAWSIDSSKWTPVDADNGIYAYKTVVNPVALLEVNVMTQAADGTAIAVADNFVAGQNGIADIKFAACLVQAAGLDQAEALEEATFAA